MECIGYSTNILIFGDVDELVEMQIQCNLGGFKIFNFHPYLGKIPILTNIFQMGWNQQPEEEWDWVEFCLRGENFTLPETNALQYVNYPPRKINNIWLEDDFSSLLGVCMFSGVNSLLVLGMVAWAS